MSTDVIESRVSKLNSLCRQYVAVLSKKREELESISQALVNTCQKTPDGERVWEDEFKIAAARFKALQFGFTTLRPALEKLVRTASQAVQHSVGDDVDGLELTVLLADLEANLQQAQMLISQLMPFASR
jgi:hypothetical protein